MSHVVTQIPKKENFEFAKITKNIFCGACTAKKGNNVRVKFPSLAIPVPQKISFVIFVNSKFSFSGDRKNS